jgi:hypothetical protein
MPKMPFHDAIKNKIKDAKIIMFVYTACFRCQLQKQVIEGIIDYEYYDVNIKSNLDVMKVYDVKPNDDIPIFILKYKDTILWRHHEPISLEWAKRLIEIYDKKNSKG